MIETRTSKRWELSIHGNERGSAARMMVVNSVDSDPKVAKITLQHEQVIVPIADLIELLQHVQAQTGEWGACGKCRERPADVVLSLPSGTTTPMCNQCLHEVGLPRVGDTHDGGEG